MLETLKFRPLFKSVVWGGRRLEFKLGKKLPSSEPYGESWEVVDLPTDQSIVTGSRLDGKTLEHLVECYPDDLLGGVSLLEGRFPLLMKFIDAQRTLSVQVHPDEAACARLGGGARPKTEAWYVIDCEPGSALFVGLAPGVDRERFTEALKSGEVESLLHRMPVRAGDLVFLPAGTVHAIGEGIVLSEVQQSSSTTYRVFDWNRVGLDGNPRQLHIEEALESINYAQVGPPRIERPVSGREGISCPYFSMEAIGAGEGEALLEGDGPLILMGVSGRGEASVKAGNSSATLGLGQTLLVPACIASRVEIVKPSDLIVLAVRIPPE